jgi:predicted O-methyltransferase YrrM
MKDIFIKIFAGSNTRKTRLHDHKGNFIGWKRFFLHGPHTLVVRLLRLIFGYRPQLPWISYTAIKILKNFLSKKSRVLEYGAGMSTLWYAKHAAEVYSIEDNKEWFSTLSNQLASNNISNVVCQLADDADKFCSFMSHDPTGFDLIVVDGMKDRDKCMASAVGLVKPGGIIYLDNSDKGREDIKKAEQLLLDFAKQKSATVTYFTDFCPGQLFAEQGLMVRLPSA